MSSTKTRNLRDTPRILVTSPDELPDFAAMTPDEEAEFWETHDFEDDVFESGPEIDEEVYRALGIDSPKHS